MAHGITAYPEINDSPCAKPSLPPAIGTAHQPIQPRKSDSYSSTATTSLQQAPILSGRNRRQSTDECQSGAFASACT